MPYGWKIEYNGVDISDKVLGFSITASLESYCREMSLDIADRDFYAELDFSQVSEDPEIEIFTRVETSWISQGLFFIERPALATTIQSDILQGVWGRSITAKLADPFAPKVSKTWDAKTTFFSICGEMCAMGGLVWSDIYSDIDDFIVYSNAYEVEGVFPIDVIAELAGLAGALVTTDGAGHVCIKRIDYAPASADETVTDADIVSISEAPEWPEFGNRVRITSTGSVAGYSLDLTIPDACLPADGTSKTKLFAQVKDQEGAPVNGLVVSWSDDGDSASLLYGKSNTQQIRISREQQRASSHYSVKVDFPPSSVDGVWAYSDVGRKTNLASSGYSVSGNTITLETKLPYCDQLLVIDYRSAGIAVNFLYAGTVPEDVTVTAGLEGEEDTGIVYIDNPCQCPPELSLRAAPSSILIGDMAALLVYREDSGPVTAGRTVYMSEIITDVAHGSLSWDAARLGQVDIENEESAAINEIAGTTQCELSMFPSGVTSIYIMDEDDDGNAIPTGDNLYASHDGKVVNLNTQLAGGTALLANYTAQGAAINHFTGEALGTARIKAYVSTTREAGTEADCTIKVVDETSETDESSQIVAGPGGDDDTFDEKDKPEESALCAPENVSGFPTDDGLAGRFGDAVAKGCTCEAVCNQEFETFGTTQGYGGASYRKIQDIVTQDYDQPEGTPGYWEKYGELKQAALQDCLEACTGCTIPLAWGSNPETISPGTSVLVEVTGGMGPFWWTVSGSSGFHLAQSGLSESRTNLLIADGLACGTATITVTDDCGFEVTGHVRSTEGKWTLAEQDGAFEVGTAWQSTVATLISGQYKYKARWCYMCPADPQPAYNCDARCPVNVRCGNACNTPISPPLPPADSRYSVLCCCETRSYIWEC
jgi:hypothetical protein